MNSKSEERTEAPSPRKETPRAHLSFETAITGAILGAVAGCLFLAVGALRILFALMRGTRIRFDDLQDVVSYVFYVGGFILAGFVVGLLWPMKRSTLGRYALGIIGATVAIFVMVIGFEGSPSQWDDASWFSTLFCSVIFGALLARQLGGD